MVYPKEVVKVMKILENNGYEAYLVGGCLRNILMGKEPHDWDMTTSALPYDCAKIFSAEGFHVIETGIRHGTVTVLVDGLPIEITTFRIDGAYSDSRHPESVTFTPCLDEDLARRDFTVNAMAYNEKRGLVDLFSGKKDLEGMILCAVGEPRKRFEEDALRILRAFRFASEHGFKIEENTKKAIIEKRSGLRNISRERIYSELCRTLLGDYSSAAVDTLIECGIMPYIFEEYSDSFASKIEIIAKLPRRIEPRLAALLAFFPHDAAERGLASLKMSNKERIGTKKLLEGVEHIKNSQFSDAVSARKFICRFGDAAQDSAELAFLLGYDSGEAKKAIDEASETEFPRGIDALKVSGSDVIALGALGRMTGEVLSFLLMKAIEDPKRNNREELISIAKEYILERKMSISTIEEIKNTKGRIMGVDFGEVRTGIAISDASRFLASGIGYIKEGGLHKTAEKIAEMVKEENVSAVVIGCPVNMNGTEGPRAERCRDLAREIIKLTSLPVAMMDERMTTMAASRFLNETNTRGAKRKTVIDTLSAQIILQNFIDRLKNI